MQDALSKEELIEAIEREFADVTREGGLGWWEVDAMDGGSQRQYDLAKERDIDTRWQEMVDSTTWDIFEWSVNWCDLDRVSFRYYTAAAMVRELKSGQMLINECHFQGRRNEKFSIFTETQNRVIAEFVLFKLIEEKREYSEILGQQASTEESQWEKTFEEWKGELPKR